MESTSIRTFIVKDLVTGEFIGGGGLRCKMWFLPGAARAALQGKLGYLPYNGGDNTYRIRKILSNYLVIENELRSDGTFAHVKTVQALQFLLESKDSLATLKKNGYKEEE